MKYLGMIVTAVVGVALANLLFDLVIDTHRIQHQAHISRNLDDKSADSPRVVGQGRVETNKRANKAWQRRGLANQPALQTGLEAAIVVFVIRDDVLGSRAGARRLFGRPLGHVDTAAGEPSQGGSDPEATIMDLQAALSRSETARGDLFETKVVLNENLQNLGQRLSQAGELRGQLVKQNAILESNLNESVGREQRLADERDFLNTRVADLERRLAEMRETQQTIVDRLTERIRHSIDIFEQTVAMTGIDVDRMLSAVNPEVDTEDSGGPFIPGDYVLREDSVYSLKSSIILLDLRMDRWEGLQTVVRSVPLSAPLDQFRVTSGFGKRHDPVNSRTARHDGLDLAAPRRAPVRATAPGQVVFAGWKGHLGRVVEIDHDHGIRTRYAHLDKVLVERGQEVGHREKIGLLGSSGRSTGPHVHYEVRIQDKPYDPMKFLKAGQNAFKG